MTAAKLVVWRHGRTEWNQTQRFQGQADIGLDSLGVEQAAQAAEVLAGYQPSALWASDLSRAFRTATALAALTGLRITTDQRLREIHVGSWEGLTGDELRATDPESAAKLWAGEDVRRSSTGESVAEVGERTAEALLDIAASAEAGSTVVVATHGLAARAGIGRLLGMPPESWRLLGSMDNCGWSVLEWHRGGGYWRIAAYNARVTQPYAGAIS
ncbi:MAG TPA: histidine phosphatase family protein [Microlunatus sp.]